MIGFLWSGETLRPAHLLGGALAVSGVAVTILSGRKAGTTEDLAPGELAVVAALGFAAAAFQGYGFLVLKPALQAGMEPLAAAAVRLLGAALAVSLMGLWPAPGLRSLAPPSVGLLLRVILPGIIGYGGSSSLLLYAFAHLSAGVAAVLGSLTPILILPILWFRDGVPPRPAAVAGAGLVVVGTALVVTG
ncbi:MAG: DMT family transporter [Thalassobaculaceae bacterium]|nr:DMT family transporter [Thalassobaculaceae bacterium]